MPTGRIYFFNEDVDFSLSHPIRMRRLLRRVAEQEGKVLNELTYVFCSDQHLHRMNVEFLNHDTLTDVITFDMADEVGQIIGELYVSIERVADNAKQLNLSFEHELARVLVHGLLHLCGYGDKSQGEQIKMRSTEDFYLLSH